HADSHLLLQLACGIVGKEEDRLLEVIFKHRPAGEARKLVLQGGGGGLNLNRPLAFKVCGQDAAAHRLGKCQMTVMKRKCGSVTPPYHILCDRPLSASVQGAKLRIDFEQVLRRC